MIKGINRILKMVGYNLVRAKRRKAPKSEAQRVKEFVEEFDGPGKVPLSDFMGETEWLNTPPVGVPVPNPGKTHYVGDNCPGGHREEFVSGFTVGTENVCIGDPTYDLPDVKQSNPANEPK